MTVDLGGRDLDVELDARPGLRVGRDGDHEAPGGWWARRDSNSHVLRHRLLRPARLPFRHSPVFRACVAAAIVGGGWSVLLVVLEVRPRRNVDTVVLGRRERPPMGHMRTVRQASASFECCRDSCFGLIGRQLTSMWVRPRPGLGGRRLWNDTCGLRRCRSTTSSFGPRLMYPRAAAQNGPTSLPASCATAMPTTWTWEGSGSIRNFRASAEIWRASSTSRLLRAPYSPEAVRTVTPSGRTSTSGKWPTTSATSAIAATNLAASANDPTWK